MAFEKGVPALMCEAFAEIGKHMLGYKEVDDIFMQRGFASVEANIRLIKMWGGEASYDLSAKMATDLKTLDEVRDVDGALLHELVRFRSEGKAIPLEYIDQIKQNPLLPYLSKRRLLIRFFKDEFFKDFAQYLPMLKDARKLEQQQVATIWGKEPAVRLHGRALSESDSIALRKEVVNSVLLDAYGALGFTKRQTKSGVITMHKVLTEQYAMIFTPDLYTLKQTHRDRGEEFDDVYGSTSLDSLTSLGSAIKKENIIWTSFGPPFECSCIYGMFRTPQELEVSIRAKALYYELFVQPYEEAVKNYQEK